MNLNVHDKEKINTKIKLGIWNQRQKSTNIDIKNRSKIKITKTTVKIIHL